MRQYLYHETKAPMIIDTKDVDNYKGWKDSPMHFIKTTDFGVDPKDSAKVQFLGESIQGVKDCCNGLLNLRIMNMKELREFASVHFKSIKARSKKALIDKIEAQNGNSSGHY